MLLKVVPGCSSSILWSAQAKKKGSRAGEREGCTVSEPCSKTVNGQSYGPKSWSGAGECELLENLLVTSQPLHWPVGITTVATASFREGN